MTVDPDNIHIRADQAEDVILACALCGWSAQFGPTHRWRLTDIHHIALRHPCKDNPT